MSAREIGNLYYSIGIRGVDQVMKEVEKFQKKIVQTGHDFVNQAGVSMRSLQPGKSFLDDITRMGDASVAAKLRVNRLQNMSDMSAIASSKSPQSAMAKRALAFISMDEKATLSMFQNLQKQKIEFKRDSNKQRNILETAQFEFSSGVQSGEIRGEFKNYKEAMLAVQTKKADIESDVSKQLNRQNRELSNAHQIYEQSNKSLADKRDLYSAIYDYEVQMAMVMEKSNRLEQEGMLAAKARAMAVYGDWVAGAGINKNKGQLESDSAGAARGVAMAGGIKNAIFMSGVNEEISKTSSEIDKLYEKIKDLEQLKNKQGPGAAATAKQAMADQIAAIDELHEKQSSLLSLSSAREKVSRSQLGIETAIAATMRSDTAFAKSIVVNENTVFAAAKTAALRELGYFDSDPANIKSQHMDTATKFATEFVNEQRLAEAVGPRYAEASSAALSAKARLRQAESELTSTRVTPELRPVIENNIKSLKREVQLTEQYRDSILEHSRVEGDVFNAQEKLDKAKTRPERRSAESELRSAKKSQAFSYEKLKAAESEVVNFNSFKSDQASRSRLFNYRMQELSYGAQDFLQVLSGGNGLGAAMRAANNNLSQFFATAGGPHAAAASLAATVAVLGIAYAMDNLSAKTETAEERFERLTARLKSLHDIQKSTLSGESSLLPKHGDTSGSIFSATAKSSAEASLARSQLLESIDADMQFFASENRPGRVARYTTGFRQGLDAILAPGRYLADNWIGTPRNEDDRLQDGGSYYRFKIREMLARKVSGEDISDEALLKSPRNVKFLENASRYEAMAMKIEENKDASLYEKSRAGELRKWAKTNRDRAFDRIGVDNESQAKSLDRLRNIDIGAFNKKTGKMYSEEDRINNMITLRKELQRSGVVDSEIMKKWSEQESQYESILESARVIDRANALASKQTKRQLDVNFDAAFRGGTIGGQAAEGLYSGKLKTIAEMRFAADRSQDLSESYSALNMPKESAAESERSMSLRRQIEIFEDDLKRVLDSSRGVTTSIGAAFEEISHRFDARIADLEYVSDPKMQSEMAKRYEDLRINQQQEFLWSTALSSQAKNKTRQERIAESDRTYSKLTDEILKSKGDVQGNLDTLTTLRRLSLMSEERLLFQERLALSGEMFSLIGGRQEKQYKAAMDLESAIYQIEEKRSLGEFGDSKEESDTVANEKIDLAMKMYRTKMDAIDYRQTSMVGSGSLWNQIQQSLVPDVGEQYQREQVNVLNSIERRLQEGLVIKDFTMRKL